MNKILKKLTVCLFTSFCFMSVNAQVYSFNSYHIYTSDEDKYLETNVQNDSSKICINEASQVIEFGIYNHVADKWMPFNLKINYKMDLGLKKKIGTLYMCTNNANQVCGVCVLDNEEGTFIDLRHFFIGDKPLSCWVKQEK